jgi:hypothetical protein
VLFKGSVFSNSDGLGKRSTSYVILRDTHTCQVYLGRDRKHAAATLTVIHATETGLIIVFENLGHELYIVNFLSSPDSFYYLHTGAVNCCGTVRPSQKNA